MNQITSEIELTSTTARQTRSYNQEIVSGNEDSTLQKSTLPYSKIIITLKDLQIVIGIQC